MFDTETLMLLYAWHVATSRCTPYEVATYLCHAIENSSSYDIRLWFCKLLSMREV